MMIERSLAEVQEWISQTSEVPLPIFCPIVLAAGWIIPFNTQPSPGCALDRTNEPDSANMILIGYTQAWFRHHEKISQGG